MKTIHLYLALAISLVSTVNANNERQEIIHEIVQACGIDTMVEDAKSASIARAKGGVKKMMDQVRGSLPALPESVWNDLNNAADRLIKASDDSWSADEAIAVWEKAYIEDFTVEELQLVLDAMRTPIGKKQIAAGKRANSAFQQLLLERGNAAMEVAMGEYIRDVQAILSEVK